MVERLSQGVVMIRLVLGLAGERDSERDATGVERAIAEIRSARPVVVEGPTGKALVVGVEDLDADKAARLGAVVWRPGASRAFAGAAASARPQPGADRDCRAARDRPSSYREPRPQGGGAHRRPRRSGKHARRGGARTRPPGARPAGRDRHSDRLGRRGRGLDPARARCGDPALPPGAGAAAENRQPGARAARGRAGERIRGFPGRRGPARSGRDHRRQAGSLKARRRAPPFRLPDRGPLRQPQMRLRRPVAGNRALDGAERWRDPPLSRPGGPRQRPRQQDPRLQAAGAGLRHL